MKNLNSIFFLYTDGNKRLFGETKRDSSWWFRKREEEGERVSLDVIKLGFNCIQVIGFFFLELG